MLDRVYAADCLILASPVYYENVSAQMKAFIDRNVFRYAHDEWLPARVVGLIAVTAETGLDDTLAALRRYVALSTDHEVPVFTCDGIRGRGGSGGGRRGAARRRAPAGRGARRRSRPQPGLITRFSVTMTVTGRSCASQVMRGTSCASKARATHGVPGRVSGR